VVPDVSGIDKWFDYVVPSSLLSSISIGCRVRVNLNGRRVGGWVVELGEYGTVGDTSVSLERLAPIVAVSGVGVDSHLIPVVRATATYFAGSLRAVLASASSPKAKASRPASRLGQHDPQVDRFAVDALAHTPVVVTVGPTQSVVALIADFAALGPVLVVCPTYRMVRLGAAALRRRGLTTAELPEQWDNARAGVDVSIGTRGAVWAPVAPGSTVIVVDEHDEALCEERSPTWNARQVALIRHSLLGDKVVLASPIPSLSAVDEVGSLVHTPSASDGAAWQEVVM
jgi:primosomal protein N' (replication factor Y)